MATNDPQASVENTVGSAVNVGNIGPRYNPQLTTLSAILALVKL